MVFPLPVSPMTTKILLSNIALMSSVLRANIGKLSLYSLMLIILLLTPLFGFLIVSFFHSGKSNTLWDIFFKLDARFLTAGFDEGSSLILLRSLGSASTKDLYCYSLMSFLSLASVEDLRAALCKEPSGF